MDVDKVMENLFPHAAILTGLFGHGGQGGMLNNLFGGAFGVINQAVQTVPQVAQAVPQTASAIVNPVTRMVPRVIQSVAPGGVPGVMQSMQSFLPGRATGQNYIFDQQTGLFFDQSTGYYIDPNTGYPVDPYSGQVYDPNAGGYMSQQQAYWNGAELYH